MTVLSLIVGLLFVLAPPSSGGLNMLFGVPVPPGFRSTEPARRALRSYLLLCTIPLAAWLLGLIFLRNLPVFSVATQLAFVVVAVVAFVVQNRRLKPYAVQPPLVREFDLSQPERLPWFTWLGIPPLALLAGIAVYLRSHWDQLPARYPAYLPLSGTPDQWDDRTVRGVYGPLILAAEIAVWLFVLALAVWYGSRRAEPLRKPAMVVMLAVEWFVVLTMGISRPSLAAGIEIPSAAVQIIPSLLVMSAVLYALRKSKWPSVPPNPTPNECWKGGILYHNPGDAALFVQRRDGFGFTFNLANRWSWAICGGSLLVAASMLVV